MNCPACNHDNRDTAKFCEECAAPLARTCKKCGSELRPSARFCDECGASLAASDKPQAASPIRPSDQRAVEGLGSKAERPRPSAPSTPQPFDPSTVQRFDSSTFRPFDPSTAPASYTPRHLAEKILNSRAALEGERKQVTVLFADVKGSMDLAGQVDPEAWHKILDHFFQILTDGVHRFEGTVNQYTGDGIMALFGAPIAHEDHAQRACYAALHLRDELRQYAQQLRREHGLDFSVRMGLNSGEVIVGRIGDDLRMDYTAQGHTVGLAARVENLAEAGCVYLTDSTASRVGGYLSLEDLGEFKIKGTDGPLRVHALQGVGPLRTRLDVSRSRGFSRFVGRVREMETLNAALASVLEGRGQIVGVVGEAGVGKSRLCFEFLQRCRGRGIPVWDAHCPAHGRAIPMLPILELTRNFFGITEHDHPAEARRKVAGTLVLLDERLREELPLAFDFLRIADAEHPLPPMEPEVRTRRLLAFLVGLMEARSTREPAVLLVDDLHWIDPESDAFVAHIVEVIARTRTLLLLNYRPEYDAAWMKRSDFHRVPLLPLGEQASEDLLRELLGGDASLAALRDRIRERSGGNPFFTEELVRSVVESGALQGEQGSYVLSGEVPDPALPATVHGVLAGRIDRLREEDKQVLQTAAVIGREFAEAVLRRVAAPAGMDLDASLDRLQRADFVHPTALYPAAEFAFVHPLTQEVAYGSQLGERRRRLHVEVACALTEIDHDRLDERAPLLAHHWEMAGEPVEAARWHARAGRWASPRDARASIRHWRSARDLLAGTEEPEETLQLRAEACREILFTSWRTGAEEAEWRAAYEEGTDLARRLDDKRTLSMLVSGVGGLRGFAGEHRVQVEMLEEALRLAREAGDFALEASMCQRLGWAWGLAGDNNRQLEWTERGIAFCEQDVSRAGRVSGFDTYAWLLGQRGISLMGMARLDEAQAQLERALELSLQVGDQFCVNYARGNLGQLAFCCGDLQAIRRYAIRDESGGPAQRAYSLTNVGLASLHLEEWEAACEVLEAAYLAFDAVGGTGVKMWYAAICSSLAQAALKVGKGDRASELVQALRQAFREAPELQSSYPHILLAWVQVLLIMDRRRAIAEVEPVLEQILTAARERGWALYLPFALQECAKVAQLRGDESARTRDLNEAYRLFTEMGLTVRAQEVEKEMGDGRSDD